MPKPTPLALFAVSLACKADEPSLESDARPVIEHHATTVHAAIAALLAAPTADTLLHDGRGRGIAEAILWHGGEAVTARDGFRGLSSDERDQLVAFVGSL
jgi:CxxC motif-containing protein (DUF1111 family)